MNLSTNELESLLDDLKARRERLAELQTAAAVARRPWCPHEPEQRQQVFLDLDCREAFYGGAAGGGKSEALLMAALQHVGEPGYAAVLFRRTYQDLAKPNALMDRANTWLRGSDATWNNEKHQWSFPSGATLTFSYLQTENDKYNHQSAEYQFVGFDELTQFTESQYLYLFSRLRRLKDSSLPLRMRSASNPGGVGHDWVKARFVDPGDEARPFISALLADNPHLDQETYRANLDELDAVTREQLLAGDWDVLPSGDMFKREKVEIVDVPPAGLTAWVRWWDLAATPGGGDWTVGALLARTGQTFYVLDVVRGQWGAADCDRMIQQTASGDQTGCPNLAIWFEQEPGSAGKRVAEAMIASLAGYDVHAEPSTGSKVVRAKPLSSQWEVGNVKLIKGAWNKTYLDEMAAFPNGPHDDQVDASSGAFLKLSQRQYESGTIRYA